MVHMTDMTSGMDVDTLILSRAACARCAAVRVTAADIGDGSLRGGRRCFETRQTRTAVSAQAFILKRNGNRVPNGYEVSHETSLYTLPLTEGCRLDSPQNMKTQRESEHRPRHRRCGGPFHRHLLPTRAKN